MAAEQHLCTGKIDFRAIADRNGVLATTAQAKYVITITSVFGSLMFRNTDDRPQCQYFSTGCQTP
jgi:hypothetical protein